MLFKELNLNNIHSELIENLEQIGDDWDDLEIPNHIAHDLLIEEFNQRMITPDNINVLIRLCDFLLIQDTWKFIARLLDPSVTYILDDHNKQNYDNFPNLKLNDDFMNEQVINIVFKFKLSNFIEYAINNNIFTVEQLLCMAIKENDSSAFDFICTFDNDWVTTYGIYLCEAAAEYGFIEWIEWLREEGCGWDWRTCYAANTSGNFDICDWVVENGCEPSYCPTGVSSIWEWNDLDHKNYIWNRCINDDNRKNNNTHK